jgi:hypothetical protein
MYVDVVFAQKKKEKKGKKKEKKKRKKQKKGGEEGYWGTNHKKCVGMRVFRFPQLCFGGFRF